MADHSDKTTTLIARRTGEGDQTGATVGSFRCTDTGAIVLTNLAEKNFSPYTGGELSRINSDYKMTLNQDNFDELSYVGQCPNSECGANLYTQEKMRIDEAGKTLHCTACGHGFISPELSAEEISAFGLETAAKGKAKSTEGADFGKSSGGPTSDANQQMGTNYDDSSSAGDSSDSDNDGSSSSDSSSSDSDDDFANDILLLDDSEGEGNGDASELDNPDDSDADPAVWAKTAEDWAALASEGAAAKGKAKSKMKVQSATTKDPLASNPGDFVAPVGGVNGEPTPVGHDTLAPHAADFPKTMTMKNGQFQQPVPDICSLDNSMMLMLHGMIAMAVDDDAATAARYGVIDADLASVNGTKVAMTGAVETDAATCFAMALEQAGDDVGLIDEVFDKIDEANDADPREALEAVLATVKSKISAPVQAAWARLTNLLCEKTQVVADVTGSTGDAAPAAAAAGSTGAAAAAGATGAADATGASGATAQASSDGASGATGDNSASAAAGSTGAATATASTETIGATGETKMVQVDVSATVDFDPRTLTVTQIVKGGWGVFASVEGHLTPIGTLEAAGVSADNRAMFAEEKTDLIRRALIATCESEDGNLGDLGFRPITAEIDAGVISENEVTARVEAAAVESAAASTEAVKDYTQGLQIAVAGMTKGVYPNPMTARLANELKRRGVQGAQTLAQRIVANCMDEYMGAVFTKAGEFAGMSANELNAVAKTIKEMSAVEVEESGSVDFSTAGIETPVAPPAARESANVIPMERPEKNVFSGIGYGTAVGR